MYIGSLRKGGAERVMVNLAEYFYGRGYKVTLVTSYLDTDEYEVPDAAWKQVRGSFAGDSTCSVSKAFSDHDKTDTDIIPVLLTEGRGLAYIDLNGGKKDGIMRVFSAADENGLLKGAGSPDRESAIPGRAGAFMTRYNKLRSIWKKLSPDLILSFIGKNNIMAILTSRGLHIPCVVSVRARPAREYAGRAMDMSMKLTFAMTEGVVLQTRGASEYFPANIRKKSVILPNSLNPAFMRQPYKGERQHRICVVGRIDENKNQAMIIRSFAKVHDRYPDWKLEIYGDGPLKNKLEDLALQLGIKDRVDMKGQVSGVADRIYDAAVFVLSSDTEGLPNSLIEAMSLGLASISTNCPYGPSEIIENGENGILVGVRDDDAMAEAMDRLLSDGDYRQRLSEHAIKIRERFMPDTINRQWEDYLLSFMRS
ncbi:glycosyltransferase [Butyrivibrio sp. MC2013]|uniref:glycosyltransferase n=1 Tax=Butyrivibrio sp. MC2013 TaxID=1280686 RepID=UPI0003FFD13C|nr:glycosyltransferase [Butyrivibrio sp. MC2013]